MNLLYIYWVDEIFDPCYAVRVKHYFQAYLFHYYEYVYV